MREANEAATRMERTIVVDDLHPEWAAAVLSVLPADIRLWRMQNECWCGMGGGTGPLNAHAAQRRYTLYKMIMAGQSLVTRLCPLSGQC